MPACIIPGVGGALRRSGSRAGNPARHGKKV